MNDDELTDQEKAAGSFAIVLLCVGLLAVPIGLGYLLGAGVGWLAFGAICFLIGYLYLRSIKSKLKAKQTQ